MKPTIDGLLGAVGRLHDGRLSFQQRVLTTGDFLATWVVEVAVHHLDLTRELAPPPPPAPALRIARDTIDALAGDPTPAGWSDIDAVLIGAGRVTASPEQAAMASGLTLPVL